MAKNFYHVVIVSIWEGQKYKLQKDVLNNMQNPKKQTFLALVKHRASAT